MSAIMGSFKTSNGKTKCWHCDTVTPAGELVASVQTQIQFEGPAHFVEVTTCVNLSCMMQASKIKGMGC